MTFLDTILREKEKEVAILKETYTYQNRTFNKQIPNVYDSFIASDRLSVIAEMKRASPSKGDINTTANPVQQAKTYESLGVKMISVLTDTPFFKGTMDDLLAVREAVDVPLLNKDFIIDPIQIDRAKDYGANVILLIVAALSKERLADLYTHAMNRGLEVLIEVHNLEEYKVAASLSPRIIGFNNRDLKTFQVDLAVAENLAKEVLDQNVVLIGESGMKTKEDAVRMQQAGMKGILVGETFMRAENMQQTFEDLSVPLTSKVRSDVD